MLDFLLLRTIFVDKLFTFSSMSSLPWVLLYGASWPCRAVVMGGRGGGGEGVRKDGGCCDWPNLQPQLIMTTGPSNDSRWQVLCCLFRSQRGEGESLHCESPRRDRSLSTPNHICTGGRLIYLCSVSRFAQESLTMRKSSGRWTGPGSQREDSTSTKPSTCSWVRAKLRKMRLCLRIKQCCGAATFLGGSGFRQKERLRLLTLKF